MGTEESVFEVNLDQDARVQSSDSIPSAIRTRRYSEDALNHIRAEETEHIKVNDQAEKNCTSYFDMAML